jgi:hypothetical protein
MACVVQRIVQLATMIDALPAKRAFCIKIMIVLLAHQLAPLAQVETV